jgi:histidinol phosphatase-like PHP family hydrolase
MIDFHTHTFASDGVLVHSELIRRALVAGYRGIGITDHADDTNMEDLISRSIKAAKSWADQSQIAVISGIEITHVLPDRIPVLAARAKEMGAEVVVVHGETITEPVAAGTNEAAVNCPDVDILAHPGLLTVELADKACANSVYLEITSRKGHSAANGHVVSVARETGASMIFSTDAHGPGDLAGSEQAEMILLGSGLKIVEIKSVFINAEELLNRIIRARSA